MISLSDKICYSDERDLLEINYSETAANVLKIEDVREAVKELKDRLRAIPDGTDFKMESLIDEIFGSKLI